MDWDAIGAVVEIIGAITALITLIYLARQIEVSEIVPQSRSFHSGLCLARCPDETVKPGRQRDT